MNTISLFEEMTFLLKFAFTETVPVNASSVNTVEGFKHEKVKPILLFSPTLAINLKFGLSRVTLTPLAEISSGN